MLGTGSSSGNPAEGGPDVEKSDGPEDAPIEGPGPDVQQDVGPEAAAD
jgi:hypothetical protein